MTNEESAASLPYEAVSVNGRAMEWQKPLWEAIRRYHDATNLTDRERAVVDVSRAVETAMRLAIETSDGPSRGETLDEPDDSPSAREALELAEACDRWSTIVLMRQVAPYLREYARMMRAASQDSGECPACGSDLSPKC